MAMYGQLYPYQYAFKYPKAGETNSDVSIYIHVIKEGTSKKVNLGTEEHYVPRIKWTAVEGVLCCVQMNRLQNHLELLTADARSVRGPNILPEKIFDEKSDTYIEVSDDLVFLRDNRQFLMTSDRDGYNHIYLFNAQGKELDQLTEGEYDVIKFAGLNEARKTVYYTSSEEGVTEKNVYSVELSGTGKRRLSPQNGNNDVVFSEGFKYFTIYHSTANSPTDIRLYESKGREIRVLVDNAALTEVLSDYNLQDVEFFTFETERGDELHGWQILPPNFDESKKYPVLLAIYGGPGKNTVTNSFGGSNYYWHQLLAQKGYIVMSVDPRGTYYRGRDFKNSTYKELGKLETEDMISTAKYLATLDYVDAARIGMQGWSYGGYLTSLCMTKGADYFNAGIAVAPVTNWRFYDSIYTERFMQTPQENPDGYDDNSPINHVEKLKGPYLLVHGSADDNVHYQNTMEMVDALVAANKEFDLFIYPNKNHGIYGGTTRLHLFNKMTDFILENL
jgi:dipeptidyl-peptidase-4